ncbi:MAG: hypothetical protein J6K52_04015 [Clostridia bacterium]|nr:hypothetical protein [Clostridia bacterium]
MINAYRSISLFLIIVILVGLLMSCSADTIYSNYEPNELNNGVVKLEGDTIISKNVEVFYDEETNKEYATIPVGELLEQLGIQINWKDAYLLEIVFNANKWVLNTKDFVLTNDNEEKIYINDLGGGKQHFYIKPKQMILNHISINALLIEIGKPCYFEINCDEKVVNLIEK